MIGRALILSLALAWFMVTLGCSGERDKGINKDADKPMPEKKAS